MGACFSKKEEDPKKDKTDEIKIKPKPQPETSISKGVDDKSRNDIYDINGSIENTGGEQYQTSKNDRNQNQINTLLDVTAMDPTQSPRMSARSDILDATIINANNVFGPQDYDKLKDKKFE